MLGRSLVGFVAVGTLVVACAAPPPAKKRAPACAPNATDCTASNASTPRGKEKDGALKTTTGAPLEAPDKAKAAHEAEAKTDPAPGAGEGEEEKPATDPVPLPTPRPDLPEEEPAADPLAGVGPKCTKLWACCYNLRQAGITGSADQCDRSAEGNDELTCEIANESYKTPDDYYDPVCF